MATRPHHQRPRGGRLSADDIFLGRVECLDVGLALHVDLQVAGPAQAASDVVVGRQAALAEQLEAVGTAERRRAVTATRHSSLRQQRPAALQVGERWRETTTNQRRWPHLFGRLRRWDILGTIQGMQPAVGETVVANVGGKIGVSNWCVEAEAVGGADEVVFWRETGRSAGFLELIATLLTQLLVVVRLTFGLWSTYHLCTVITR